MLSGTPARAAWFDDVEDDPGLVNDDGTSRFDEIRRYWERRQPEIVTAFDRSAGA